MQTGADGDTGSTTVLEKSFLAARSYELLRTIRNRVRFHILSKNPICSCGAVMEKQGYYNGKPQRFKCMQEVAA